MEYRITDDLQELKRILPLHLTEKLDEIGQTDNLLEIVLDLGRVPAARYTTGEVPLSEHEVTRAELDSIAHGVGVFDTDNRAGMERTLHRISAIRNRRGEIVGLTCRVGRAVYGTVDIVKDLIESGQSVLLLGPPGVGKTTLLREAARVLAETKRVVIVDTSNEIGGDGDVPHPAVGKARRMQVSQPERQHEVMIEAVENHNPEVIVIDEIGRELEAMAARTIAERGVQLIGTAHGNALDNLMLNPTLSDLVGGIGSVTLSDEEARRRGTQKTVLERRAPATFDVLIEIQTRDRLIVHEDVAAAVDAILRERPLPVELRTRDADGEITVVSMQPEIRSIMDRNERSRDANYQGGGTYRDNGYRGNRSAAGRGRENGRSSGRENGRTRSDSRSDDMGNGARENGALRLEPRPSDNGAATNGANAAHSAVYNVNNKPASLSSFSNVEADSNLKPVRVYAYGVARNRLQQGARRLKLPLLLVDDEQEADIILTIKNYYRRRPKLIVDAERNGVSIYVLRANTGSQMEDFLLDIFGKEGESVEDDPFGEAMREVRDAVVQVRAGSEAVDLAPQGATIRRRQHEFARRANIESQSYGDEPARYVRLVARDA